MVVQHNSTVGGGWGTNMAFSLRVLGVGMCFSLHVKSYVGKSAPNGYKMFKSVLGL